MPRPGPPDGDILLIPGDHPGWIAGAGGDLHTVCVSLSTGLLLGHLCGYTITKPVPDCNNQNTQSSLINPVSTKFKAKYIEERKCTVCNII